MRSGCLYARATSAPAIGGSASSSSLPTPSASKAGNDTTLTCSGDGRERPNKLGWAVTTFLPTPAVNDMGEGKTPEAWDTWTDSMRAKHGNGNGHGRSLAIEAQRLLPTPSATNRGMSDEAAISRTNSTGSKNQLHLAGAVALLPTPTTSDAKGPSPSHGGTTAEAIRDLRSASTSPPSSVTSSLSGELLLLPPTTPAG